MQYNMNILNFYINYDRQHKELIKAFVVINGIRISCEDHAVINPYMKEFITPKDAA